MPLFEIQDDDRPMFVVAENYDHALTKWKFLIKSENKEMEGKGDDTWLLPNGVRFVCYDSDLLL